MAERRAASHKVTLTVARRATGQGFNTRSGKAGSRHATIHWEPDPRPSNENARTQNPCAVAAANPCAVAAANPCAVAAAGDPKNPSQRGAIGSQAIAHKSIHTEADCTQADSHESRLHTSRFLPCLAIAHKPIAHKPIHMEADCTQADSSDRKSTRLNSSH